MDCEDIRKQIEDRVEQESSQSTPPTGQDDTPKVTSKLIQECLIANELGDATLYAKIFRGRFLYVKNTQEWFEWNGNAWQRDIMNHSLSAVEEVVDQYLSEYKLTSADIAEAKKSGEDDKVDRLKTRQSNLLKRVSQLRADKRRTACLKFAHTIKDPISIAGEEFDNRPLLFPCANGVIDLETGRLKSGRPDDFLSLVSPVPFIDLNTPAPLWERSLLEIFGEKEHLVTYLQRLFGYCMTGLVHEKVFPIFYGRTGWNGRSLIIETVSYIMGALAGPIPSEMLLSQKYIKSSSGPSPDIMSLKGIRMAFSSEVDEGQRFSASKIKWLTGKDQLVGRSPHDKYPTRFAPTHKIILMTNSLPHAPANDQALWERLHVIPFLISFVNRDPQETYERRAIIDLDRKMLQEASGILAWLIRGCLLWQRDGLDPPFEVTEEGRKYQSEQGYILDFKDECCKDEVAARETAAALYNRFVDWYHQNRGKKEPSPTAFGKELAVKYRRSKSNGIVVYHGIRLKKEGESEGLSIEGA
ncbi:MAG: hypothetical protein JW902_03595 [Syntrophaceae bacterium]|nr:hypothetical protein [Syntrophaceae bacterium]